jgi:Cys-tRNA(Pro)/Cys-tRNA(Cys) deacylase
MLRPRFRCRFGVTVLGAKKPFGAFIDAVALKLPTICVSGGMRGLQILLSPAGYVKATGCTPVENLGRP